MNATQARALVALAALWLTMTAGAGAQRAGGPGDANESAQLPASTPGKGQILLTYAGGPGPMPVYRSTDNGETFQPFSELKELRRQPTLFELPAKVGELESRLRAALLHRR